MPRELFGNVTRPSISVGSRKWYTLPLSIVSHSLIVVVIVALPILAPVVLPLVAEDLDGFVMISVPKPPPLPTLKPASARPAVNPNAAPIEAPSTITKETGLEAGFENSVSSMIDGGIVGEFTDGLVEPPAVSAPPIQPPLRVGGAIRSPVKVSDVAPIYPPLAQAARVQGIVILEATIGADGRVVNARVLRSVPLLDQAALDAVRQWVFTPTLLNGAPVPVVMTVTVQFTLR
jgi:protein TonB